MLVYHGGRTPVIEIDLQRCRPYTDFGRGFYVTKYKEHAENWARRFNKQNNKGFVTTFNYIESQFSDYICKKKKFDGYTNEWLDFIVNNRNEEAIEQTHGYDIVEGPVANDKVQNRLYNYHEDTHQICFCTLASFQTLKRIENELTVFIEKISEDILNNLVNEKGIDANTASDLLFSSKTFYNIADDTTDSCKRDWKDIYKMLRDEIG